MPDLLAGTTILAQDTPETVDADVSDNELNISSTSYIAGAVECSTTFTAPTTGRVIVHVYGQVSGDGTHTIMVSFEVYEGSDSTGTLKQSASDNQAVRTADTIRHGGDIHKMVSGLTPGVTHFARTMHRVTGGTTMDVFHRRITIEPAS